MAVIITNMDMPKSCRHCHFSTKCGEKAICLVTMKEMHYSWIEKPIDKPMRPLDCPLKEVNNNSVLTL